MNVKRVYEQPADADGTRVLVDRVWPRGLTNQRAAANVWLKEIAPSADLRKWFGHDPSRWKEFEARYRAELDKNGAAIDRLRELITKVRSRSSMARMTRPTTMPWRCVHISISKLEG